MEKREGMQTTSETYKRYVTSDAWSAKRSAFLQSGRGTTCAVCGAKEIQLHHRTYVRFGREHLDDLVPLCQEHHSLLHQFQRDEGLTVEEATRRYLLQPNERRRREESTPRPAGKKARRRRAVDSKALTARGVERARRARLGLPELPEVKHVEPPRTETGAIRSSGQRKLPKKKRGPKPRADTKKTQPYPW